MTKDELNKSKNILEAKQAQLAQVVRNHEGIAIEKDPDLPSMKGSTRRNGNLAIRNLNRESNPLRNARSALRRIDEGTCGVCLHCEEDISTKRLAAVPWTAFCTQCQEIADRSQTGDGSESLDELLVNAA